MVRYLVSQVLKKEDVGNGSENRRSTGDVGGTGCDDTGKERYRHGLIASVGTSGCEHMVMLEVDVCSLIVSRAASGSACQVAAD